MREPHRDEYFVELVIFALINAASSIHQFIPETFRLQRKAGPRPQRRSREKLCGKGSRFFFQTGGLFGCTQESDQLLTGRSGARDQVVNEAARQLRSGLAGSGNALLQSRRRKRGQLRVVQCLLSFRPNITKEIGEFLVKGRGWRVRVQKLLPNPKERFHQVRELGCCRRLLLAGDASIHISARRPTDDKNCFTSGGNEAISFGNHCFALGSTNIMIRRWSYMEVTPSARAKPLGLMRWFGNFGFGEPLTRPEMPIPCSANANRYMFVSWRGSPDRKCSASTFAASWLSLLAWRRVAAAKAAYWRTSAAMSSQSTISRRTRVFRSVYSSSMTAAAIVQFTNRFLPASYLISSDSPLSLWVHDSYAIRFKSAIGSAVYYRHGNPRATLLIFQAQLGSTEKFVAGVGHSPIDIVFLCQLSF